MSLRKLSNNKLPRLIMRLRIRSLNKAQKGSSRDFTRLRTSFRRASSDCY